MLPQLQLSTELDKTASNIVSAPENRLRLAQETTELSTLKPSKVCIPVKPCDMLEVSALSMHTPHTPYCYLHISRNLAPTVEALTLVLILVTGSR